MSQTAQALFDAAFSPDTHRDPRSAPYKAGALAALEYRCAGTALRCPYPAGTAEADAWFAGTAEGHALWRESQRGTAA